MERAPGKMTIFAEESMLFPMKPFLQTCILAMAFLFSACGPSPAQPKGNLIYCSYSASRAAGLGKSYCELIADPGTQPRVVVRLDQECRLEDVLPKNADIPVDASVVEQLQQLLASHKVYKLNGYRYDEVLDGGTTHRIYMEYDSGDKVDAVWCGHKVKEEAWSAYWLIERFFEPWRSQAVEAPRNDGGDEAPEYLEEPAED